MILRILLCLLMMSFLHCLTLSKKLGSHPFQFKSCQTYPDLLNFQTWSPRQQDSNMSAAPLAAQAERSRAQVKTRRGGENSHDMSYHPKMRCIFTTGEQVGGGHWGLSFSMQAASATHCQLSIDKALHHMGP
jgi:hypothetical protein